MSLVKFVNVSDIGIKPIMVIIMITINNNTKMKTAGFFSHFSTTVPNYMTSYLRRLCSKSPMP